MALRNTFKILIVLLVFLIGRTAFSKGYCEPLFSDSSLRKNLVPTYRLGDQRELQQFKIKSITWLKQKLINEGELVRLRDQDPKTEHSVFLSEMLVETVSLLRQEFYGGHSILKRIDGAQYFYEAIVSDAQSQIFAKKVTQEYFFQINYTISHLMALKNKKSDNGRLKIFLMMVENARATGGEHAVRRVNYEYFESLKNDKSILSDFEIIREAGIVPLPTFAEISVRNFMELGIEVLPVGMTSKSRITYDGFKNENANSFFIHDIFHGKEIHRGWVSLTSYEKVRFLIIQEFLKKTHPGLTKEENQFSTAFLFEKIHNHGRLKDVVDFFYEQQIRRVNIEKYNITAIDTYRNLTNPAYNPSGALKISKPEFDKILRSALEKLTEKFHNEHN